MQATLPFRFPNLQSMLVCCPWYNRTMHGLDGILFEFVLISFVVVAALLILHALRQPSPVAYIVAGVLIGPFGFAFFQDQELLSRLGEIGVIILLFFIGAEFTLRRLRESWKTVLVGTLAQIALTVALVATLGFFLEWPIERSILLAFVLVLSSTAVVFKLLREKKLQDSRLGAEVAGVLVMQDLMLVPMLLVISALGSHTTTHYGLQALGVVFFSMLVGLILYKRNFSVPASLAKFVGNHEHQLFLAFLICFGFALLANAFKLSFGFGAFLAGLVIANTSGIEWVRRQLRSFEIFLVALFFISIGMLIDLDILREHWFAITTLVLIVFLLNTVVNASIFHVAGHPWRTALFAGALLAQIGEFSFLIAAEGLSLGVLTRTGYQIAVLVIAISILLSPLWVKLFSRYRPGGGGTVPL